MLAFRLPLNALQEKLYDRLRTDAEIGVPVFDNPGPDRPVPYIVIGDFASGNEATKHVPLHVITASLYIWTKGESMKELNRIADEVIQALTRGNQHLDLSESQFRVYDTQYQSLITSKSFDGTDIYQQGKLVFLWKIQDLKT